MKCLSVVELHRHARGPGGGIFLREIVGDDDPHVRQERPNVGYLRTRALWLIEIELLEPDHAVEESRRDAVGETELRLIGRLRIHLFHDLIAGAVGLDRDSLGKSARSAVNLVAKPEHHVDRRMRVAAAGMQLEAILADLPMRAESVRDA